MAVPGHDERDFDFAKTYDLPIKRVLIENENGDADEELELAYTEDGYMVHSGMNGFDGRFADAARTASSMPSKPLARAIVVSIGRFALGSSVANATGAHRFQSLP